MIHLKWGKNLVEDYCFLQSTLIYVKILANKTIQSLRAHMKRYFKVFGVNIENMSQKHEM